MYHPTTRVLTVLELLQSHREISGPEIADRLEVDVRTVRRYVTMLQDLGIPVEGERGRYGTYRLMPGFKLPPLMLNEDEALAVTLGLLVQRQMGLGVSGVAVEGALAKIQRVMPESLRARLKAVQESLVLAISPPDVRPRPEVVVTVSTAVVEGRRVEMRYRAFGAEDTLRQLDPYGLVYRAGFWYTVGYCHLRQALRTFRLDRMQEIGLLDEQFERPLDFDSLDHVERSIANTPGTWLVDVLLHTTLEEIQCHVPRDLANLVEADGGVVLRCYVQEIDWFAQFAMGLPCRFTIREPEDLRDALRRLAAKALERADGDLFNTEGTEKRRKG
jgi:predicted DNA-binding transcriptional regulator YafY